MIEFVQEGNVALITMNRPEARNAVNGAISRGLEDAIDRIEADDSIWSGILTHTGPVFSAGADLKAISEGRFSELSTERGGFGGIVLRDRSKPLIAAIDGPALAGGTEIALTCDLRVASTNARFGLPEVKRSLIAAAGGLVRLPRALPLAVAMEMVLTGDPISAERALHFGLINELCEPGTALDAARRLAQRGQRQRPSRGARVPQARTRELHADRPRVDHGSGTGSDGVAQHGGLPRGPAGLHREAAPGLEGPLTDHEIIPTTVRRSWG